MCFECNFQFSGAQLAVTKCWDRRAAIEDAPASISCRVYLLPSTAENHHWESFQYSHVSSGIDKGPTQCQQARREAAATSRSNLEVHGTAGFQRHLQRFYSQLQGIMGTLLKVTRQWWFTHLQSKILGGKNRWN